LRRVLKKLNFMRGFLQTLQTIFLITIASFAAKGQTVTINASSDTVCVGSTVTLTNTNNFGANNFVWQNPGSLIAVYTSSQTVVLNTIGVSTFTLQATNFSNGDYAITTKSIVVGGPSTYAYAASICSGSTYAFNGQNLSTAGTYKDTFQNVYGCDSVVTLNLTINSLPFMPVATATSSTICQGDTTLLKALPNVYTYCLLAPNPTIGDYIANVTLGGINNTTTYPGAFGYTLFPKTASTTTTLNAGSTYTISVKAGTYINNYIAAWIDFDNDGVFAGSEKIAQSGNLSANGIYTVAFTVPAGAINGDTRMRVFENNNNTNIFPCINATYGEAEDYTVTITGGANPPTFSWTPVASASTPNADSTLVFPTATTIYTVTATNNNGCTNTNIVSITVNMPSGSTMVDTICANTPYTFNGQSITATGTYYDTLVNAIGCDSIITLNLYAKPISNYAYADTICAGTPYTFNGQSLTATGAYYDTLVNAIGCDSFVTLNLTVNSLPIMPSVLVSSSTICQGDTTLLKVQSTAPYCLLSPDPTYGDYVANVTLGSINNTTTYPSIGGYNLFAPTANTTTTLTAGSTYTISLQVGYFSSFPANTIGAWIDFNRDGVFDTSEKIAQSGNLSANGIYTVAFTVPPGSINGATRMRVMEQYANLNLSPCVTNYGDGEVEDYTVTLTGGANLATSFAWAPSTSVTAPGADSTFAFPTSNTTYTVTGTDLNGCTNTASVNITVNMPSSYTITDTICSGNAYVFGSQSLTASGTYYDTLVNALGCDSFITLNLTVSSPSTYTYADTICAGTPYSFNGQNLTASGTYYDTLANAGGCDSIVTLNLTVNVSPIIDAIVYVDTVCQGGTVNLYVDNITNNTSTTGLVGPFAEANGSFSNIGNFVSGGFDFTNAPYSVTAVSSNGGSSAGPASRIWTTGAVAKSGNIFFDWSYSTTNSSNYDYLQYSINGAPYQDFSTYNASLGVQTGFEMIPVTAGDVINFKLYGINSPGTCTVVLSNFNFISPNPLTYAWTGNGIADPTQDTTTVTLNTPGLQTLFVTGTTVNGCTSTDSVNIVVNALPTVNATTSSDTLCQGNMVSLSETTPSNIISGFVGPFDPANGTVISYGAWANGGFNFTNAPTSVTMVTSSISGNNSAGSQWTSDTIMESGIITFNWSHVGNNSSIMRYRVNGGSYMMTVFPIFNFQTVNTAGTGSIAVNPGDVLNFELSVSNPFNVSSVPQSTIVVSNFNFTPTTTYLWSGNGLTNPNAKNTSALLNTAGSQTYTVQVTNSFGCSNADTVNVYVKPSSTYAYADTICAGTPYSFNGQNLTASGTYYDTLVNAAGCDSIVTLNLIVNPAPSISNITASATTICSGDSASLSVQTSPSSAYCLDNNVIPIYGDYISKVILGSINNTTTFDPNQGYTFYPAFPATTTTLSAGDSATISLKVGTTYTVSNYIATWIDYDHDGIFSASEKIAQSGALGNGDVYTTTFAVPTNAINGTTRMRVIERFGVPNINPCANVGYGEVEDYTITIINGASVLSWAPTASVSTPTAESMFAFPTVSTIYTVTATNNFGCTNTSSISITVNALPNITATASDDTLCQGNAIRLIAANATITSNNLNGFVGPFAPANGTFTTTGYFPSGGFDTTNTPYSVTAVSSVGSTMLGTGTSVWTMAPVSQSGTITFDWSFTENAVYNDEVTYSVNNGMWQYFNGFTSPNNSGAGTHTMTVNAGDVISFKIFSNNVFGVCTYVFSNFNFTSTGSLPTTYLWSGNGLSNTTNDTADAALNIPGVQTYTVVGTDVNGCSNSNTVSVFVTEPSTLTINDTICTGTLYTFNGQNLDTSGTYYDTLVNAAGCDSIVTLNLFVRADQAPPIAASISKDTICQGNAVNLTAVAGISGFTGPFDPANGTLSTDGLIFNGGFNFSNAPNSISMVSTTGNAILGGTHIWASDVVQETGWVSFDWSFTTTNTSTMNSAFGGYIDHLDVSAFNILPTSPMTGFNMNSLAPQSGTKSVYIPAGERLFFQLYGDNDGGNSTFVISNFSFSPSSVGPVTYAWNGAGLSNANIANPGAVVNTAGSQTYTVTVTDNNGCTNSTSLDVYANASSAQLAAITSSQTQTQADGTQITYTNNNCDVIAGVTDAVSGNLLGNTISTVTLDATAQTHNSQPYCRRHYDITPANQGAAVVTLYATFADFLDYNTLATATGWPLLPNDLNDTSGFIPNVRVTQVHGTGGLGTGVSELITPTSVTWNNTLNAWQITFPVDSFSSFFIHTGTTAPLAINLLNFSGDVKDASDVLHWTTSSEINSDYFELQYSTDAKNFSTIASIDTKAPNGNSATALDYTYTNAHIVAGYNYYKLKSVDKTGKAQYSNTIKLHHQAINAAVSVVPNPFTNNINVVVDAAADNNVNITVHDASGRIVYTSKAAVKAGKNELSIATSDWAGGIYFVNVKQGQYYINTIKVTKL
jgi:hypothetical protein